MHRIATLPAHFNNFNVAKVNRNGATLEPKQPVSIKMIQEIILQGIILQEIIQVPSALAVKAQTQCQGLLAAYATGTVRPG